MSDPLRSGELVCLENLKVGEVIDYDIADIGSVAVEEIRRLRTELKVLKGELKASEDGTGITNIQDQLDAQMAVLRTELAKLHGEMGGMVDGASYVALKAELVKERALRQDLYECGRNDNQPSRLAALERVYEEASDILVILKSPSYRPGPDSIRLLEEALAAVPKEASNESH